MNEELKPVLKYLLRYLLKEVFYYNNRHIAALDRMPCKNCHTVPEIKIIHMKTKRGKDVVVVDRTNRIDCEYDRRVQEVYCVRCWNLLVQNGQNQN